MPAYRQIGHQRIGKFREFVQYIKRDSNLSYKVFRHCDNKIWRVYDDYEIERDAAAYQTVLRANAFIQVDFSIEVEGGFDGKFTVLVVMPFHVNTPDFSVLENYEVAFMEFLNASR